jgi:hypothetical protein
LRDPPSSDRARWPDGSRDSNTPGLWEKVCGKEFMEKHGSMIGVHCRQ